MLTIHVDTLCGGVYLSSLAAGTVDELKIVDNGSAASEPGFKPQEVYVILSDRMTPPSRHSRPGDPITCSGRGDSTGHALLRR